MTEDKDFKRLVREHAEATGRNYTAARAELRPTLPVRVGDGAFARRFSALEDAVNATFYGKPDVVRLSLVAMLAGGSMLFSDVPGTGFTVLAMSLAAATGGSARHVAATPDQTPDAEILDVEGSDVLLVTDIDRAPPRTQNAMIDAGRDAALFVARRHVVAERAPHPLSDDQTDRFLFGLFMGYLDAASEGRIVQLVRSGGYRAPSPVLAPGELAGMRAAARAVEVPADVRRYAVNVVQATRVDPSLLMGASAIASVGAVEAAAVLAAADGRSAAIAADVDLVLPPVLLHRLVFRDPPSPPQAGEAVSAVLERARTIARA